VPFSPVPSIHFSLYSLFSLCFGTNKVELSWEKIFKMSSIVLHNSFKTLSPFVDALVNKCLRQSVPLSHQRKVSVGQRSQTGVASKLRIFMFYKVVWRHSRCGVHANE